MTETQIYDLLNDYGIQTPKFKTFNIYEQMRIDFYPIVLKIESPKVVHKSDVGGVILNINSDKELDRAKKTILKNLSSHDIYLDEDDKLTVIEMVRGEEFYLGGIEDPIFSKVLLFGRGGIYLEIDKDICYIDINSDIKEILSAFSRTKISKLFPKFRGKKYDIQDVINLIQNFQKLLKENVIISEIDLNPLIYNGKGFVAVDARVKFAYNKRQIKDKRVRESFFKNENIAIIGVSSKKHKIGYGLAKNALKANANLYFVGKGKEELFNKKVYSSIETIDSQIDTAVIAITSELILDAIVSLVNKGVKNVIIISAGFKESGNIEEEAKITSLALEHNLNIIGPNCLGYFSAERNLNLTFAKGEIAKGSNAIISQSGAILSTLIDKANEVNIGFSHIISLGNMSDLNFANTITMLNQDPNCKTISIYAEGIKNGKEFLASVRESKKPIYLFKVGRSEQSKKAAFSHTGNLSGNYYMFVNLLRNMSVVIEDNIDALIYAPKFKAYTNILLVTNAGGPAAILSDYISDTRAKFYELENENIDELDKVLPSIWSKNNPIDIIGDATSQRYDKTLEIVQNFSGVDVIYLIVTPQYMTDSQNIAKLMLKKYKKPIIPLFLGGNEFKEAKEFFRKNKIFYFDTLKNAVSFL